MSAKVGYQGVVNVSNDGSTWVTVGGVNNASTSPKNASLDRTYMAQGDAFQHFFKGLPDGQAQLSLDWLPNDPGQALILARADDGAACHIQVLQDGTNGLKVEGLVSQFDVKGSTTGKVEISTTIDFNGLPSQITNGTTHHGASSPAPVAGHHTTVKTDVTPVTMTGEACSQVGSTKTYKITASAHRRIDPRTAVVVKDGGTAVDAANIQEINFLLGTVTFVSSYTVGGAVTIDGAYVPLASILIGREFSVSLKRAMLDKTAFGDTAMKKVAGLKTVDITIKSLAEATDEYTSGANFWSDFQAGTAKLVDIDLDGSGTTVIRAWALLTGLGKASSVANLQELSISAQIGAVMPAHPSALSYVTAWTMGTP